MKLNLPRVYVFLWWLAGFVSPYAGTGQVTVEPTHPTADEEITITYNATQGVSELEGAGKVYMHAGVILDGPEGTSWENVVGNWGMDDGIGQMTKVPGEENLWRITLVPRTYFSVPEGQRIYRIGMVFRNEGKLEGKNDNNGDIFITVYEGGLHLSFISPTSFPVFTDQGATLPVEVAASDQAGISFYLNDNLIETETGTTTAATSITAGLPGRHTVKVTAETDDEVTEITFDFIVRASVIQQARPPGIRDGINYLDDETVIFSLQAPFKKSVYVLGDFTDWKIDPARQMKQDGEHFWLEVTGLTPGREYGFMYLVDEKIYIADPYADKILDPDRDPEISEAVYPGLMDYPEGAPSGTSDRVAVFQTGRQPYAWKVTGFQRPEEEDLVIYELLLRDFLGSHTYETLTDTLSYLERLGVNAIELMPVMEFNGNSSWGYNPAFMFAVDKYYGPGKSLKRFIDEAHNRGMAVILDMVLNQNDYPAPFLKMYWDQDKPAANNPWFNREATHPFNVFSDFNHESAYTKSFTDSVTSYWLTEYKFDGFRFDLSKGFTQTNSGEDVAAWGQYDQSRIDLLKRIADHIWSIDEEAYIILEHFAENREEKILSDYGMMLWGNMHYNYKQANLGYQDGWDLSRAYYKTRDWNNNLLVSYMESHDEQRQMFELLQYGNSKGGYNSKEMETALNRLKQTATFFFTVPGPKMIWQFGEMGFDTSIDVNGRTGEKPPKWNYLQNESRKKLQEVYAALIDLRQLPVFREGEFTWSPEEAVKTITITHESMDVVIIGNFDVVAHQAMVPFTATGSWYDYFTGETYTVTNLPQNIALAPGQFHILTSEPLEVPGGELVPFSLHEKPTGITNGNTYDLRIFPVPNQGKFVLQGFEGIIHLTIEDIMGRQVLTFENFNDKTNIPVDISSEPPGLYLIKARNREKQVTLRVIKK